MILSTAKESLLHDFPEYVTIDKAIEGNDDIHNYLNTIIQKELLILLNRFYAKFWSLDDSTIEFLVTQIKDKLKLLNMKGVCELKATLSELPLTNLSSNSEDLLSTATFTAILYGESEDPDNFLYCLKSLTEQNMISLKIIVPSSMKTLIQSKHLLQKNIIFSDCKSKKELFNKALENVSTPYIVFCDEKIVYSV